MGYFFLRLPLPNLLQRNFIFVKREVIVSDKKMLSNRKNTLFDRNYNPAALQTSINEFNQLEEVIENYGLARLMDETKNDERLSIQDAKDYYKLLKYPNQPQIIGCT